MSNKLPTKRQLQQWLEEARTAAKQADLRTAFKQNEICHLKNQLAESTKRLNRLLSLNITESPRDRLIYLSLQMSPEILRQSHAPHEIIMSEIEAHVYDASSKLKAGTF